MSEVENDAITELSRKMMTVSKNVFFFFFFFFFSSRLFPSAEQAFCIPAAPGYA